MNVDFYMNSHDVKLTVTYDAKTQYAKYCAKFKKKGKKKFH